MASNFKKEPVEQMASSGNIMEHAPCGYPVFDMDKINDRYKCVYCIWIMKEPTQLVQCGHRCCRGCFENRAAVAPDENMVCPVDDCQEKFRKNEVK